MEVLREGAPLLTRDLLRSFKQRGPPHQDACMVVEPAFNTFLEITAPGIKIKLFKPILAGFYVVR